MTKKAAKAHKAAWNLAIAEGRMLRFPALGRVQSYPTIEARVVAEHEAETAGLVAQVVDPRTAWR